MQTNSSPISDLSLFEIDAERGFLPAEDPLRHLPSSFSAWEEVARELPKLFLTSKLRHTLQQMPLVSIDGLMTNAELKRAMLLLSYFGHAYVWADAHPAHEIPVSIARPWHEVSKRLERPPILSYASYALENWRRLDAKEPIALGNISLLQNFLGGVDEEWFVLVHVEIEAKAAPALAAMPLAWQAVVDDNTEALIKSLEDIAHSLQKMFQTLCRMPEYCDPYIYYNRVRPYIHGWKDNPALPRGVVYEGVDAFATQGQFFRGETGAQSSIIPAIDRILEVGHEEGPLKKHLLEMEDYMPKKHRLFLQNLEKGSQIRKYVVGHKDLSSLREAYNECIIRTEHFRSKHLEFAANYIQKQNQQSESNPTDIGTGGTPFMPYLKKHRDETTSHLID